MASVLGMLEEREAAARVRVESLRVESLQVESLREEAARLAEVLAAAEIELDRRGIAREELVEALVGRIRDPRTMTGRTAGAPAIPNSAARWRKTRWVRQDAAKRLPAGRGQVGGRQQGRAAASKRCHASGSQAL
ncbi:hypothetical protein ACFWDQ_42610, partial [Streptomyces sp. NPDC060053]